ncbi:MAG: hypothetical protein V3V45_02340 [Candidatus Brocadiales bacterium]
MSEELKKAKDKVVHTQAWPPTGGIRNKNTVVGCFREGHKPLGDFKRTN